MIVIYDCDSHPTDKEIKIMLKSLKPGKEFPPRTDFHYTEDYPEQLVNGNYLDLLLEGYTLKFVKKRTISEQTGNPYLTTNSRLLSICSGIGGVVSCSGRGLNLEFEWNF